jgi:microsomal prostaglandin-E synthase 2
LDYARIPYAVVEVDPLLKGQLKWSKDYKKVPVAVVNGIQLNDSQHIIDEIDRVLQRQEKAKGAATAAAPMRPAGSGSDDEVRWREWGTNTLVQVLTANIYRSFGEAWETFDYLTQRDFPVWSVLPSKLLGAAAMTAIASKRSKQNGWDQLPGKQREGLYNEMNKLADAIDGSKKGFIGGEKPCLADIELFGAIRSIKGLPTHSDLLNPANTRIGGWYQRMEVEVGDSKLIHRVGEAPPDQQKPTRQMA